MFELPHKHLAKEEIIVVELVGTYPNTDKEIDRIFQSFKGWRDIYNVEKFIVNYYQVDYSPSAQQMIKNTQRVIDSDLTEANFAIVFDINSESYARYKLFLGKVESNRIIKNHNPKYKVFSNIEDAKNWLSKK